MYTYKYTCLTLISFTVLCGEAQYRWSVPGSINQSISQSINSLIYSSSDVSTRQLAMRKCINLISRQNHPMILINLGLPHSTPNPLIYITASELYANQAQPST
ncbi:hypothetical protein BO83DRAFT_58429 [Aspergillus eucalypticola CBS 122712]|uniref:Uncharacterized protein n=1 Tax=Aspergillus eucalypticola (strain CBS 122712 / IBT 29274) TaxID=1448314 RepID=A0A317V8J6_ASPEC|nr:uncharacterized protein BO83DRAFT_58429 [Aspergillus eucalypticola CBS 122712]PWY70683.1 hypothetical protein BO83DRAFT_58429 [Aspergillus eucalypticola CBS 122712]